MPREHSPHSPVKNGTDRDQHRTNPRLYLDLKAFVWLGLGIIIVFSPLMRGLFFEPDLVLALMGVGLVTLITALDLLMKKQTHRPGAAELASFALAAAYGVACIGAVDIRGAVGETVKYLAYTSVLVVAVYLIRSTRDLYRVLGLLWLAAVLTAAVGVLAAVGIFAFPGAVEGRVIASTLQYKNALAAFLLAAFIIGLGLTAAGTGAVSRIVIPAGNFLLLLVLFNTFSRGTWILMPIVLMVYCLLVPRDSLIRTLYHVFLTVGAGFFAGRYFVQALAAGHTGTASTWVIVGAAVTAGAAVFYDVLIQVVESWRAEDAVKKVTANVLAAFLVLNVGAYVYYSYVTAPALSGEIVPGRIKSYSQAIHPGASSYDVRSDYYKTALNMFRDYPLTGAGGRGWAAVYHRYQPYLTYSTEVHSHYLQVLVESGIIGFAAYVALWGACGWAVYRAFAARQRRTATRTPKCTQDDQTWLLAWSAGAAVLTIGVHSAYDFDLSFPALALWLWVLLGAVWAAGTKIAVVAGNTPHADDQTGVASLRAAMVQGAVFTVLSLLVMVPAWRANQAGHLGALGAQALAEENLYEADQYYTKAVKLDPLQATYHADLAQVYAVAGLKQRDPLLVKKAWNQIDDASRLKPYDPKIRAAVVNTAQLLGDRERAAKEAEILLDMNPLDVTNYEILSDIYLSLALDYLAQGKTEQAERSFTSILSTTDTLEKYLEAFHRRYPAGTPYWQGRPLAVTDRLMLRQAQALTAQGEYDQAESLFRQVRSDNNEALKNETAKWLAALYTLQGRPDEAETILKGSPDPEHNREESRNLTELLKRISP